MQKNRHMLNMFVKCFFLLPESVMSDLIHLKRSFGVNPSKTDLITR